MRKGLCALPRRSKLQAWELIAFEAIGHVLLLNALESGAGLDKETIATLNPAASTRNLFGLDMTESSHPLLELFGDVGFVELAVEAVEATGCGQLDFRRLSHVDFSLWSPNV